MDNAIVMDDYKVLNNDLRYNDEFVKHKISTPWAICACSASHLLAAQLTFRSGHAMTAQAAARRFLPTGCL
jgi:UDP-3-O-acyl-N-acetylglucosamine deacetylase